MEKILTEIKSVADKVAKKSGELVEISKIKLNIVSTKSSIEDKFKTLGELVYNSQKENTEDVSESFEELIIKIDKLYDKLSELEEASAQVSNKKICPVCKKINVSAAEFCSHCGTDLT